ncbi:MAG TPA: DUF58 domain-containing protein [Candidatus Krumholzibacteria bacterium]|nr:DUF58 domain-containing protein [Candidatus Krumholzibacteria bacterium]HPD71200.1 DUF58 domain-containing protein [Candidatus Krumholzibacteria bacterium]HRY39100.1 DUF58 domain-containing protein [Candidatus Krumholzibacteria bacterium]
MATYQPQPANPVIPPEILAAVRRIEIRTRRLVDEVFSGEYHSVFRGRGVEFREVREYVPGDDVRAIDWNVTARTDNTFVKQFEEERELTVMLAADVSGSGRFGSGERSKAETAAELCGILAFAAISNKDKVGLLLFSDHVEKYIPPAKGRSHVLRLIRELLTYSPVGRGTDLEAPLQLVGRVLKRKATVFLVSDFWAGDFSSSLRTVARRHDCVAVRLRDPRERDLPDVGFVAWRDAETGREVLVDTSSRGARRQLQERVERHDSRLERQLRQAGVDLVDVDATGDYVAPLQRFFLARAGRRRRGGGRR